MPKPIELPDIPDAERTPLVDALVGLIETLAETIQRQAETIQQLRDEIAVLKGEKGKPTFRPSGMEDQSDPDKKKPGAGESTGKRAGSSKRSKTPDVPIHEECVIPPTGAPPSGSRFKGYRDFGILGDRPRFLDFLSLSSWGVHLRIAQENRGLSPIVPDGSRLGAAGWAVAGTVSGATVYGSVYGFRGERRPVPRETRRQGRGVSSYGSVYGSDAGGPSALQWRTPGGALFPRPPRQEPRGVALELATCSRARRSRR
jgi:hypothetical protein